MNSKLTMKKLSGLLLLLLLISSCKKEKSDFIWQRSFGAGAAVFVNSTPDSGIISCGEINGNPYLLKLSENKSIKTDFTSVREGTFSSAWYGDSCFIAGGSSNGKMLLARIDYFGSLVWDTLISTGFNVELTRLSNTGPGTFLAIGSAAPASSENGNSGLVFIKVDTAGTITKKVEPAITDFVSANNFTTDNQGNVYVSLTRKTGSTKTKACVAKYNADLQKLWEIELYNNSNFGAGCLGVAVGGSDSLYVTGETEVTRKEGTLDNSYIASISLSGQLGKKKYLENSNSGSDMIIDASDEIILLNRNCFLIDVIVPLRGYEVSLYRMFNSCDPYDTDAFGSDLDFYFDGNIIVAGSKGGNFYLAVKASPQ